MASFLLFKEMKRKNIDIVLILLFQLFATAGAASAQQSNPQPSPPPKPSDVEPLELNTILMRSTFKLIGNGSTGTAFVVARPSTKNQGRGYWVLVTAAHVLEQSNGNEAALLLRTKETESYAKGLWPIQIRNDGKPLWTKHPKVDVAVMYISLPMKADVAGLPSTFLATDKMLSDTNIHPGDNLFCLGYPNGVEANDGGFPILRSGRIASYPILPTAVIKSFLFDFNVFDGNSGGPVYL